MEFLSAKQDTQISLRNSDFWPPVKITELVVGNCEFRAVAHIIHCRESVWPKVRKYFIDQLNSDSTGYLRGVSVTSGGEISLQSLQASPMHFVGPIWDRSKSLDSGKQAQLTTDAYDTFVVMVTYNYSNVVIRASSSFQSANALRAATPTDRLLGMVFRGCGGTGHLDSIDIGGARVYAGGCEQS